ncbi:ROK family protein [Pedobacter punctiformis]|uniref:ROK family protein n=1 Tax=Pedobacter punctiformis TaxID=3004097 RepID=A0ABT4L6L7_9SPHI|nr:ROK family protein [Pedobacter sp. HCMS5-2]MCZ4243571.1 ROK family protein [Pedobacter sp. HCMS5-2]
MSNSIVLGVDIGGSHITAALIDLEQGILLEDSWKRESINSLDNAETILENWSKVISDSLKTTELPVKKIGIAMPGPFNYNEGICLIEEQDKFKSLYKVNIKTELAARLNVQATQIRFINDAEAFVKGEVFAGSAKGAKRVMGLTLGTGLGAGIYEDGESHDLSLWNAPFLNGISEDYLSTRWFVGRYQQLTGIQLMGVKELVEMVKTDHAAVRVFMEFGHNMAGFLMPIIKKYKLEMVIIGGNISLAFDQFSPELVSVLEANQLMAKVKITKLNEHAALIGAACL